MSANLRSALRGRTFSALSIPNYRRYAFGQSVSLSGTWMQRVAQAWLVLELGGSGTDVGVVTALQFLPLLVLGAWAGVVVDRVDKRRLLVTTQSASAVLALGLLTATGVVRLWMVMVLAAGLGVVHSLDVPARQSFVMEMVGRAQLSNAVTLMAIVGGLGYEFQVVLPLLARYVFDGDAGTYGAMTACMGFGAVVAGLVVAGRERAGPRSLVVAAYIFGTLILVAAAAPTV